MSTVDATETGGPDRIQELAAEIIAGSKAAAVDPTVIWAFIQAFIAAFQECRQTRPKRIARRARRARKADVARLAERIEGYLRPDQDKVLLREQAVELAERTMSVASRRGIDELSDLVEELQDAGTAW